MNNFLFAMIFAMALLVLPDKPGLGQKKQAQCWPAPQVERNWEVVGGKYIYFDYVLCPADATPPQPLVRVWITTEGDGFAVEKWAQNRVGADNVTVFSGKKKAYTLYRDLDAIPLRLFKSERRAGVPDQSRNQPFLLEGSSLIPSENLTPVFAAKAIKVFENADVLIRTALGKGGLLHESERMGAIIDLLDGPPKARSSSL